MTDSKMAILTIFLILGTIYNSVESAPTAQDNSKNLQNGINQLHASFIKSIKSDLKSEKNALYSPFNIYAALALLQLGTNGETRNELSTALKIPLDESGMAAAHGYLGDILNEFQTMHSDEMKIANSAFIQKGLKVKDSYLQATKKYYKSEAQKVDFAKKGSEATYFVNDWVANNTKQRIPKLFAEEIPKDTQILLASSLFFNASWQNAFNKKDTKNEAFNTGAREVSVPTMHQRAYVPYMNFITSQYEAISIPFQKDEFNMVIVLPYENHSIDAFIDQLDFEKYQREIEYLSTSDNYNSRYVDYKIPRMKFRWSQSINKHLKNFGVKKTFSDSAELDNMVEQNNLKVSDVIHATDIQVDENGAVAAAAIGISMILKSADLDDRPEPITFYVDRPFLFSIHHKKTGVILFAGIVQNPSL